jgi:hypothetical protein
VLNSARARERILVAIGVTTPLGILVVNGSALVMAHLTELRLALAACALISSLLLNGLTAAWVLGFAARTTPDLYREYRRWITALAAIVVVATSAGAAYFTYLGMQDPRRLPDALAVLTALAALVVPFAISYVARRRAAQRPQPGSETKPATPPLSSPAPSHRHSRG